MTGMLDIRQRLGLELHRRLVREQVLQHPLTQLFWECTLRCNMHCRHCGSDCKTSPLSPDMPFEDFEKVLLRIREVYDSHKVFVILSGGEPLVRPDIVQCARRIYELEFPWGMVSNGRLMDRKMTDRLLWAGMRSVTISLDGLQAEHDWMRGTPDAFSYASEAIKILSSEQSLAFDVVTCVNQRNLPYLSDIKEYLISLGVRQWRLFTVFPVGRAASDPQLQLSGDQYRKMLDFIVCCRKEGRIDTSYACEGFLGPYEGKVRDHLYTCLSGTSVASVRVDGGISGCNSVRGHFDQGNIYRDDFIDVWENRFQLFRFREWMREDQCGDCKWWRYCQGNGMHLRDDRGRLIMCNLHRLEPENV